MPTTASLKPLTEPSPWRVEKKWDSVSWDYKWYEVVRTVPATRIESAAYCETKETADRLARLLNGEASCC